MESSSASPPSSSSSSLSPTPPLPSAGVDIAEGARARLVGRQDPDSMYFTRRCLTAEEGHVLGSLSPSVELGDLDPDALTLYSKWLATSHIHLPLTNVGDEYTWPRAYPLINALILARTIGSQTFYEYVFTLLDEAVTPGMCADVDTIEHLFADGCAERVPEEVRQWVVDRCIDAGMQGLHMSSLPGSFAVLVAGTALRRLYERALDGESVLHGNRALDAKVLVRSVYELDAESVPTYGAELSERLGMPEGLVAKQGRVVSDGVRSMDIAPPSRPRLMPGDISLSEPRIRIWSVDGAMYEESGSRG